MTHEIERARLELQRELIERAPARGLDAQTLVDATNRFFAAGDQLAFERLEGLLAGVGDLWGLNALQRISALASANIALFQDIPEQRIVCYWTTSQAERTGRELNRLDQQRDFLRRAARVGMRTDHATRYVLAADRYAATGDEEAFSEAASMRFILEVLEIGQPEQ